MKPPYWSLVEVEPADWWAVDAMSGTAFSLPAHTGERLWRSHALLAQPLSAALEAGGQEDEASAFVDLELCGVTTRYLCYDEIIARQLASLYAGAVPALRRSPAVLVRIGPAADCERLHRSVPKRAGVAVRPVEVNRWAPGSGDLPIIPPLQSAPLADHYCALHGALLRAATAGVLICGAQRTGKTSAALLVERLGFATVLADELVLIDRRGEAHGVPLPVRERSTAGRSVSPLPRRGGTGWERVEVATVILLESSSGLPSWTQVTGTTDRLRLLTAHIRALDGPLGRATTSVLRMLSGAGVWSWRLRPWPLLAADLEHGFRSLWETTDGC